MSERDEAANGTGDRGDAVPGSSAKEGTVVGRAVGGYALGLIIAAVLTAASFFVPQTDFIWRPALPIALVVLAVAQMGIHLVFFLHITTAPDNTNNALALAFGILIVLIILSGSLWIMASLAQHMSLEQSMGHMMGSN